MRGLVKVPGKYGELVKVEETNVPLQVSWRGVPDSLECFRCHTQLARHHLKFVQIIRHRLLTVSVALFSLLQYGWKTGHLVCNFTKNSENTGLN